MDDGVFKYLYGLSLGYPLQVVDPLPLLNSMGNTYLNDGTSFIIHEMITVIEAGHTHSITKNGYDGVSRCGKRNIEAKTSNVRSATGEFYKRGRFKGREFSSAYHSGTGVFSCYTDELHQAALRDDVLMLVSGFIDGRLLYIVEFPYAHPTFVATLEAKLDRHRELNAKRNNVIFDYRAFIDCPTLKLVYGHADLAKYEHCFNKKLYDKITEIRDGNNPNRS